MSEQLIHQGTDSNSQQENLTNELQERPSQNMIDEVVKEELLPPQINLKISSDNMIAYIRVLLDNQSQEVTVEDIQAVLSNAGVVYGICTEDIKKFCENRAFFSELIAARGTAPINGENGSLQYHFKTDNDLNLLEAEDGTVNYRELGLVKNVKMGQVLVTAVPPKEGVDGITIFGQRELYIKGIPATLQSGENTEISEDGTQIIAAIDGCVEIRGQNVVVNDVYTVKGDVNISVGNIDCLGSVVVHGDVREGFTIKAKKDIIIKGMIEGATIISGGKVTISNGMNGMNRGKIIAEGDVISKYFENAKIESNGDIYSDVIMNSKTTAKGSVILKGGKSSIIGGTVEAGKMVYAGYIGTQSNTPTVITINSPEIRELLSPANDKTNQIQEIEQNIADVTFEQEKLQANMKQLSKEMMNDPQAKVELKKVMVEKNKLSARVTQLENTLEELKSSNNQIYDYKVVATKTCYTGTRINIGYVFINITEDYNNTKFFAEGHTIGVSPVSPADRQ